MIDITLNGECRRVAPADNLAQLLDQLGFDRRRIAVEINQVVIPQARHGSQGVKQGDAIEIVTLVGGGAPGLDKPLVVGKFTFQSRLITGTGKYASHDLMRACLDASGCAVTTVAIRYRKPRSRRRVWPITGAWSARACRR